MGWNKTTRVRACVCAASTWYVNGLCGRAFNCITYGKGLFLLVNVMVGL